MRKSNTSLSNCLTTTKKEKYLPSGAACSVKIFASPAVTDNGIPCTLPAATLTCKLRRDSGPCTTAHYAPITKKFIIIIILLLLLLLFFFFSGQFLKCLWILQKLDKIIRRSCLGLFNAHKSSQKILICAQIYHYVKQTPVERM